MSYIKVCEELHAISLLYDQIRRDKKLLRGKWAFTYELSFDDILVLSSSGLNIIGLVRDLQIKERCFATNIQILATKHYHYTGWKHAGKLIEIPIVVAFDIGQKEYLFTVLDK